MIGEPRRTGLLGELKAAQYLRKKNYDILAANYRTKTGEIDIVADDGKHICFIEVKTRREGGFFPPETAVDEKKEENVKSTAAAFITAAKIKRPVRFDIIEVILCENNYKVRHIKNAF